MGEKWDVMRSFHSPISPFLLGTVPTVPFIKISSPHSPSEKWEFLPLTNTHCHSG